MAVGLQQKNSDVWKLFAAIGIHSVAIVFCISVEMINSRTKKLHIILYISVFALIASMGVVIGIIVTEHTDNESGVHTLVIGILQGLAGGTLLYITFYEVMDREKLVKAKMTGVLGFAFLFFGFAFMAGLEAMGEWKISFFLCEFCCNFSQSFLRPSKAVNSFQKLLRAAAPPAASFSALHHLIPLCNRFSQAFPNLKKMHEFGSIKPPPHIHPKVDRDHGCYHDLRLFEENYHWQ